MKKVLLFLSVCTVFIYITSFSPKNKDKIKWMSIKEVQVAYAKDPKPIMIDVYTDWCKWCKVMDKDTYQDEKVISFINEHLYAVKFDAETFEKVNWNGKEYNYNYGNKVNELAEYFLHNQLAYPSTTFLNGVNGYPIAIPGYMDAKEIELPLKYYGQKMYDSINFDDYQKTFKPTW